LASGLFEKKSAAVDFIDRRTLFFMAYLCLQYNGGPDAPGQSRLIGLGLKIQP